MALAATARALVPAADWCEMRLSCGRSSISSPGVRVNIAIGTVPIAAASREIEGPRRAP
jgi:hypothetical protein